MATQSGLDLCRLVKFKTYYTFMATLSGIGLYRLFKFKTSYLSFADFNMALVALNHLFEDIFRVTDNQVLK